MDRLENALEIEQCAKQAGLAGVADSAQFFISGVTCTQSTLYRATGQDFARKWRETKQQLILWPELRLLG